MSGFLIEAEIEQLTDRYPELKKNLHVKRVLEDQNQLLLALGPTKTHTFLLTHSPTYPDSNSSLTMYSEDEALSDWNMHMMEFSERKNMTLEKLLLEAVKKYTSSIGGTKQKGSKNSKSKSRQKQVDEDVLDYDDEEIAVPTAQTKQVAPTPPKFQASNFFTGTGSRQATDRLIKDLNSIARSNTSSFGYSAQPIGDNLYCWEVKLFGFDPKSGLAKDLQDLKRKRNSDDFILLDMKFPSDYPFAPPFIRVVRPRFEFHTGHVTIGGSICMELLTKSGWLPSNDIESILVQIRTEMLIGNARLDLKNTTDYTELEAQQAFERVARQHKWM